MKHLYIIEDDLSILEALTFLLAERYHISGFSDPHLALNELRVNKPNLILVDLLMPLMSGREFIKTIAQWKVEVPIVVMSASSNIKAEVKDLNVASVIQKPFDIAKLEAKIMDITH